MSIAELAMKSPFVVPIPLAPGFPLLLTFSSDSHRNWRNDDAPFFRVPRHHMEDMDEFRNQHIYRHVVDLCANEPAASEAGAFVENLRRFGEWRSERSAILNAVWGEYVRYMQSKTDRNQTKTQC